MRYYVKVEDGDVVEGPLEISASVTESPNTDWPAEQMLKHGFYEVNLLYNPQTEKIDYDNPTVTEDSVVYPRLPLSDDERVEAQNTFSQEMRRREYPSDHEITQALWSKVVLEDDGPVEELIHRIDNTNAKYPIK